MAGTLSKTSHSWASTARAGIGVLVAAIALIKAWSVFRKNTDYQENEAGQSDKDSKNQAES